MIGIIITKISMSGLDAFDSYKYLQNLTYSELKLAVNYICAQMNSPCLNYAYWYDMYCYTSKSFMVMDWRKKEGLNQLLDLVKQSATTK